MCHSAALAWACELALVRDGASGFSDFDFVVGARAGQ